MSDLQILPDGVFDRAANRWLADDEIAELGIEVPQDGHALEHPETRPEDLARARVASILEAARLDLLSGDLHPFAVRARLAERPELAPPPEDRRGRAPASIVKGWTAEGPLAHVPTGLKAIDEATGGGPVFGTRWYMQGAPDAGKTVLLAQIAHAMTDLGLVSGLLAVDEEPGDVVTRIAQRLGFTREECEQRDASMLDQLAARLESMRLRFYDHEWTIEQAAADVARTVRELGAVGGMLGIDSVHYARCNAELGDRELSMPAAITARVEAIRGCAREHRLIVIATSEMGRASYRDRKADDLDPMAASKWSSAVEYSARVLLSLRSVPKHADLVRLEVVKNKHGRKRLASEKDAIFLELDRDTQVLSEASAPGAKSGEEGGGKEAREERATAQNAEDGAALAIVLAKSPGLGSRDLRAACRAASGTMSTARVDVALFTLGPAVVRVPGPNRAVLHHLDGSKVADEVLRHVQGAARATVIAARPPRTEGETDAL